MAQGLGRPDRSGQGITRRGLAIGAGLALLAGPLAACGAGGDMATFDLTATPEAIAPARRRGQLLILEPIAPAPLDSDRLIVRPTPDTVATLKGAQWSDALPRLVQTRLLRSFEDSHMLQAVARPGTGLEATHALSTEIRRFDIDVTAGEAVVEVSARLVSSGAGRIEAARIFSARAPASAKDPTGAAMALDASLARVSRDLIGWAAGKV